MLAVVDTLDKDHGEKLVLVYICTCTIRLPSTSSQYIYPLVHSIHGLKPFLFIA